MPHRSPVAPLALLACATLVLSSCSLSTSFPSGTPTTTDVGTGGTPGTAPASGSAAPSSHPRHNSSDAPDWGTGSQGQQAAEDSTLTVADVRIGNHPEEGYSRLVVEF